MVLYAALDHADPEVSRKFKREVTRKLIRASKDDFHPMRSFDASLTGFEKRPYISLT